MAKPVLTKRDFVRRYAAGEFGNAAPTWCDYGDWLRSKPWRTFGVDQLYHVRNRVPMGHSWYNIPQVRLGHVWAKASYECGANDLYISAMAPHHCGNLQGEILQSRLFGYGWYNSWPGLYLHGTYVQEPMRDALAIKSFDCYGSDVMFRLRMALNKHSLLWMFRLLREYPGHVIEFSSFDCSWGTVPKHNTVFWEVRRY